MTRLLHGVGVAMVLIGHVPASAQTAFTCGRGTVRAVEAISETVTRETITTHRNDAGDVTPFVQTTEEQRHKSVTVTVQLRDRLYTSRSTGDPYGSLDPLRLVSGDTIDLCASAAQMILERPDGTDYRAPVVQMIITPNVRGQTDQSD